MIVLPLEISEALMCTHWGVENREIAVFGAYQIAGAHVDSCA